MSLVRSTGLIAAALLGTALMASPAGAQLLPYGYYYGYGSYPYGSISMYNNMAATAANTRAQSEQRAMAQNQVVQSGIRSSLMDQALAQTDAANRQTQANRDWWFQVQQQQMAQRQAMAAAAPPVAAGAATAPAIAYASIAPGSDSIIKWPPILRDPRFADGRAQIEAPYRRQQAGGAGPDKADYLKMVEVAAQMKSQLPPLANQVTAAEYLGAEKFLDQLAAEAQQRADELSKPAPAAPKAAPAEPAPAAPAATPPAQGK